MKRDNGQGMFTMDFINEVSKMTDLDAARARAHYVIDASKATDNNKRAARAMVCTSRTLKNLLIGMANFSLSHQGLAVK